MRRRNSKVRVLSAVAVASVAAAGTAIGVASPAGAAGTRSSVGTAVPTWAVPTAKVAPVADATPLTAKVYLKLQDSSAAEARVQDISDPSSADYQHYLTPAQADAQLAPTSAAVAAVSSWLQSSGFTITSVPSNNLYVQVTGTAAEAEQAFGTTLNTYAVKGQKLRGAATALTGPASVASYISGVTGVSQTLAKAKPQVVPPSPGFRVGTPCSAYYGQKVATNLPKYPGLPKTLPYAPCGYTPPQIRSAYGLNLAAATGLDGRGATVAVVDAYGSPTILSDAQTYAKRNDPSHPLSSSQFSQFVYPPTPGTEPDPTDDNPNACGAEGWYGEETLDVEAVHATAPGANIHFVGAADCSDDALNTALNSIVAARSADVVSNSYGDIGEDTDPADYNAFHEIALLAANEGITLTFSSGDDGDEVADLGFASADSSATDPLVTAVGGTTVGIGKQGQVLFTTGWEDSDSTLTDGAWTPAEFGGGSGGGTSVVWAEPWYQKPVVPKALAKQNVPAGQFGRVVPDISMLGEPSTGLLVGQTQTFPDGVYYDQYRIGGTSVASPLFAGEVALSVQAHHRSQGFINPVMYLLLSHSPAAIADVKHVTGGLARINLVNGVDTSDGTSTVLRDFDEQDLAIKTTPGYDNVTGLGTPNSILFPLGL